MKRNSRKKAKGKEVRLRTWTHAQAEAARPYLTGVIQSMREHFLEVIRCQGRLRRFSAGQDRPTRTTLIEREEARRALDAANARFEEAETELHALDVYSLDPVQGLALVPFIRDEQLAWFVFDLFDEVPLRSWRYQDDPLDTRRPVETWTI
jgi:hypothetical protein